MKMRCPLFGCCVTSAAEDEDDIRSIGLGRMKYSDKSQAKTQLSLTNGDGDDVREDADSFYETPSYVVEASVVTVSGLQPVQVFEGTIFHESERRGLKKYASPNEVAARRKRRQNQAAEQLSTKKSEFNELHHSAKQLLRCGQMLYGSGQEESAAVMFERSLQASPRVHVSPSPFCFTSQYFTARHNETTHHTTAEPPWVLTRNEGDPCCPLRLPSRTRQHSAHRAR